MTIPAEIAALASRLQAQRQGHVLPERYRPRVDLDDPDLFRRLTATVEGHDDAEPVPVKAATEPALPPGVLTVEKAAQYLSVTPDQLKGLITDGALRYINLGRGKKRPRIGLTTPDLDDFIEHRRQRAVAPCPSLKSKNRRSTSTNSNGTVIGFMARRNARLDAKRKR